MRKDVLYIIFYSNGFRQRKCFVVCIYKKVIVTKNTFGIKPIPAADSSML